MFWNKIKNRKPNAVRSSILRMEILEDRRLLTVVGWDTPEETAEVCDDASTTESIDLSLFTNEANELVVTTDDDLDANGNVEKASTIVTTKDDIVNAYDGQISLREAIAYAGTNGLGTTVTFDNSLRGKTIKLAGKQLKITKSLTIDASALYDDATNTPGITIDANKESRVMYVMFASRSKTLTLNGLAFTGGKTRLDGGALYVYRGTIDVTNVKISGNEATDGGGICVSDSVFKATNVTITNNRASHNGGGVCVGAATFNATNVTISDNEAWRGGGVSYARGKLCNATNVKIEGNKASDSGGGVYSFDGNITLNNAKISNNIASGDEGGGISASYGNITLNNTEISNNIAKRGGGGIRTGSGNIILNNVKISNNTASKQYGGGVYFSDGTLSMVNSEISGNTTEFKGGGLFQYGGVVTATNTKIVNNTVKDSSNGFGGGVFIKGNATFNAINTEVSDNKATKGGGVFVEEGKLNATNVTIAGNEATTLGGGIFMCYGSTATLNNSIVAKNANGDDVYKGNKVTINAFKVLSSFVDWSNKSAKKYYEYKDGSLFVGKGDAPYDLSADSAAIDKGSNDLAIDASRKQLRYDLAGNPRIYNKIVDLGAYERGEESTVVTIEKDIVDPYDGKISLREAIAYAGTRGLGTTVTFAESLKDKTIQLVQNELEITKSLTIDASALYAVAKNKPGIMIDANGKSRVMNVAFDETDASKTLTLIGLTLMNGAADNGGGLSVSNGTVVATNVKISKNNASNNGGGVYVDQSGTFNAINSEVSDNNATKGGGVYVNGGAFKATNVTIAGNSASSQGGGVYANSNTTATLNNSIVAKNANDDDVCNNGGKLNAFYVLSTFVKWDNESAKKYYVYQKGSLFVGTGDTPYALSAASEALNRGDDTLAVDAKGNKLSVDLAGNPRFYGTVDLGAYEKADEASTTVTTEKDIVDPYDGQVSLREAIAYAGTKGLGTTVTFANSLTNATITLTQGELKITKSLTIDASALYNVKENTPGITINANQKSRVMNVAFAQDDVSKTLTLNGLTLTGGNVRGDGGGLCIENGTVDATNARISKNTATQNGGGVYVGKSGTFNATNVEISGNKGRDGGGVNVNTGTFNATNVKISDNTITNSGGGGVFLFPSSTFNATNVEISGNTAKDGGGVYVFRSGTFNATNVVISSNTADDEGGGVQNSGTFNATNVVISSNTAKYGGGVYVDDSIVNSSNTADRNGVRVVGKFNAINTEISGNKATEGGGVYATGGAFKATNVTIAGNEATGKGGGVYVRNNATATLNNSIVARNANDDDVCNNGGTLNANKVLSTFTGWSAASSGIYYAYKGGSLFVGTGDSPWSLTLDSMARDQGDNALAVDAKGVKLTSDLAGNPRFCGIVDLGAYEKQETSTIVTTQDDIVDPNDGKVSLREAIAYAGTEGLGTTVTFDNSLNGATIKLAGQKQLEITKSLTIDASSLYNAGTIRPGITIDARGKSRVMNVAFANDDASKTLTLIGMTLTGGSADNGGGLRVSNGTVVAKNVKISKNTAKNGGGVYVDKSGTFKAVSVLISDNNATKGGGIYLESSATFDGTNVTIANNKASGEGGGVYVSAGATATLKNSIVVMNSNGEVCKSGTINAYNVLSSFMSWSAGAQHLKYDSAIRLFTNASQGDYTLTVLDGQAGRHQAYNKGNNAYVSSMETDLDLAGDSRVAFNTVDLGAYEYHKPLPQIQIVGKAEVGSTLTAQFVTSGLIVGTGALLTWYCGSKLVGTGATLVVTPVMVDSIIRLVSNGRKDYGGGNEAKTSKTRKGKLATPVLNQEATADVTSITVSWNSVPNAGRYKISYKLASDAVWKSEYVFTTSYKATGLTSGQEYQFTVQALDGGPAYYNSSESAPVTYKTKQQLTKVSISGTVEPGKTLTATAYAGNVEVKNNVSYQWYRVDDKNETPITGANQASYKIQNDDVGFCLKVTATGKDDCLGTASSQTAKVLIPLEKVSIKGEIEVGKTLTATTYANKTEVKNNVSYQWYRVDAKTQNPTKIDGATQSTYKIQNNDVDYYLKVEATGTGKYTKTVSYTLAKQVPTQITASITGKIKVGEELTAKAYVDKKELKGADEVTYQWYRVDSKTKKETAITGATKQIYKIQNDDVDFCLKVKATGTGTHKGTAESKPTEQVPSLLEASITGKLKVGEKLTAKACVGKEEIKDVTYQWYRVQIKDAKGKDVNPPVETEIKGATKSTYTIEAQDVGFTLKVKVGGSQKYKGTVYSKQTDRVAELASTVVTTNKDIIDPYDNQISFREAVEKYSQSEDKKPTVKITEVEDPEVEDAEVEDAEVEDAEVEDAEVEDAEVEDADVENKKVEITFSEKLKNLTITIDAKNGAVKVPAKSQIVVKGSVVKDPVKGSVTLNGGGKTQILSVAAGADVELVNLTIKNGKAAEGGAIVNKGTLALDFVTLTGNQATERGGAIFNSGKLTLTRTTLQKNSATSYGGAIYNDARAELNFTVSSSKTDADETKFGSNSALNGGAVANYGTTKILENANVAFKNNTAQLRGGAYYGCGTLNVLVGGKASFTENKVQKGKAPKSDKLEGGAIYNDVVDGGKSGSTLSGEIKIEGTATFVKNEAPDAGGAIFNKGKLALSGTKFQNDKAGDGGAIANTGTLELRNLTFNNNTAENNGGAIFNNGELKLYGSTFKNNSAQSYGGAIYNDAQSELKSDNFTVVGGALFQNNSAKNGGAIANYGKTKISKEGDGTVDFKENTAKLRGGAYYGCGTLTVEGKANFIKNKVQNGNAQEGDKLEGGAIYNDVDEDRKTPLSGEIKIEGSATFDGNKAQDSGGAIFNKGKLTLRKTTFTKNSAKSSGGAIYNDAKGKVYVNGAFESRKTTFTQNSAENGGAIANYGKTKISTLTYVDFKNNTAKLRGGAYYGYGTLTVKGKVDFEGNSVKKAASQKGVVPPKDADLEGGAIYNGVVYKPGQGDQTLTVPGHIKFSGIATATFTNNSAPNGGAIANYGTTTISKMSKVEFLNNKAQLRGGAYYGCGTLTVKGTAKFEGNAVKKGQAQNGANLEGGAIYNDVVKDSKGTTLSGKIEIAWFGSATFENNSASNGGAIANYGTTTIFKLANADFVNNTAQLHGGAYYGCGTLTVEGTANFEGNSVKDGQSKKGEGGAIYNAVVKEGKGAQATTRSGKIDVTKDATVNFENNSASNGGAIATYSKLILKGETTFSQNKAQNGGAIYVSNAKVNLEGATISENTAAEYGGGVYATGKDTTVRLAKTEITDNKAVKRGGGVYVAGGATVNVRNVSTISSNRAASGAGVYVLGSSTFTMTSGKISGNTVFAKPKPKADSTSDSTSNPKPAPTPTPTPKTRTGEGGGIYAVDADLTLINVAIVDNIAKNGGGVYTTKSTLKATNVTIAGNKAQPKSDEKPEKKDEEPQKNEDVLDNDGKDPEKGKETQSNGGGIYADVDSTITLNNSIVASNPKGDDVYLAEAKSKKDKKATINANYTLSSFVEWSNKDAADAKFFEYKEGESLFLGEGDEPYALTFESVAKDKGSDALAVDANGKKLEKDGAGNQRFYGKAVDLGAYEKGEKESTIVTTSDDVVNAYDGKISLREAIAHAGTCKLGTTVTFDASLKGKTIKLADEKQIEIAKAVTIDASALCDAATGTPGITIDADRKSRVFYIHDAGKAEAPVALIGLKITKGNIAPGLIDGIVDTITGNDLNECGGGIYVSKAFVTIKNGTISENTAADYGGGVYATGAESSVTLDAVLIEKNVATNQYGGGVCVTDGATVVVQNGATITGNQAVWGGGVAVLDEGKFTLTASTISANVAKGEAQPAKADEAETDAEPVVEKRGGGVYAAGKGKATLINALVVKNEALNGGGIYADDGATIAATNATTADNKGGGAYAGKNSTIELKNSIVAANQSYDVSQLGTIKAYNVLSSFSKWSEGGKNLVYDATKPLFKDAAKGDYSLIKTSQVVDKGDNAYVDKITTDFSGYSRIAFGTVDLGAYEYHLDLPQIEVQGKTDVGSTLTTVFVGDSSGKATATYQWSRVDAKTKAETTIKDANKATYVVQKEDVGYYLKATAVGTGDYAGKVEYVVKSRVAETASTVVTTEKDVVDAYDGKISLREAINHAGTNGLGTTITFDNSLKDKTITLAGKQLEITRSLTIDASALYDEATKKPGITIDANKASRVMSVKFDAADVSKTLTLKGLTLTGGKVDDGGGLRVYNGTVVATNVKISGNAATHFGGGVYVDASGTFNATNAEISSNAASDGGGVNAEGGTITLNNAKVANNTVSRYAGGVRLYWGTINIANSEISGNKARVGGGVRVEFGVVTATNTKIVNNTAEGGIGGGGVATFDEGTFNAINSEISGNKAANGGGVLVEQGAFNATNVTIAGNKATSQGGGVFVNTGRTATLNNSIVAKNDNGDVCNKGTINAFNVLSFFTGWSNAADRKFYQYADGSLFVGKGDAPYQLTADSEALDKGDNKLAIGDDNKALTVDLAGNQRIYNGIVDLGAYEFNGLKSLSIGEEIEVESTPYADENQITEETDDGEIEDANDAIERTSTPRITPTGGLYVKALRCVFAEPNVFDVLEVDDFESDSFIKDAGELDAVWLDPLESDVL